MGKLEALGYALLVVYFHLEDPHIYENKQVKHIKINPTRKLARFYLGNLLQVLNLNFGCFWEDFPTKLLNYL